MKNIQKSSFLNRILPALFVCFLTILPISETFSIDKSRYITVDEVSIDMDAYCLTIFEGTKIEKFPLKILSVIRNWKPQRDAILVAGTEERFNHAGTVHGCSGSPVYIDGKLAGALAAGWDGSQDALYIVTPFEYMLQVGTGSEMAGKTNMGINLDFSDPIELKEANNQYIKQLSSFSALSRASGMSASLVPLSTSLPEEACTEISGNMAASGFRLVSAGSAANEQHGKKVKFEAGGVFALPLLAGDISMSASGTVTEVIGDTVYAMGHSFMGIGPLDMPISGGIVHTVVPGRSRAFKFAQPGPVGGALLYDEFSGMVGKIGARPRQIPLNITVTRFNDPQQRVYNCMMCYNSMYSPLVLQSAISGAGSMLGSLPPQHTVTYESVLNIEGYDPVHLENLSSGNSLSDAAAEPASIVTLIINNRFGEMNVKSIDCRIDIQNKDSLCVIRSASMSDAVVKAGDTVTVDVVLQRYMSARFTKSFELKIPDDLQPGTYEITLAGGDDYEKYVRRFAPYKFTAYDPDTLVKAIRNLTAIRKNYLYLTMKLPASGISVQQTELPYLPNTKAMLFEDVKRTTDTKPMQHWIDMKLKTDAVINGSNTLKITVEK